MTTPEDFEYEVALHGFKVTADGGTEYCDQDDADLKGWGVYLRTTNVKTSEFDISRELDFDRREEAYGYAEHLCREFRLNPAEINDY